MVLPRFVALRSNHNGKFLEYRKDGDREWRGVVFFSSEELLSPYTRFELIRAKSDKGLVHIRCCINNKYWMALFTGEAYWISASADEPEEDPSKWPCTLYEPIHVNGDDDSNILYFRDVSHLAYTRFRNLWPYDCGLSVEGELPDTQLSPYTIIDLESLPSLPKNIAFKADNSRYLCAEDSGDGWLLLRFTSDDIAHPMVRNETIINSDGSVWFKLNSEGKFWDILGIDDDDKYGIIAFSEGYPRSKFWPVKLEDNNVIALRHMNTNKFAKRYSNDEFQDIFVPEFPTITQQARLVVEEPLLSREIYDVDFHLSKARIYNQSVIVMATGNAVNHTEKPNTIKMKLSRTETKTDRWNATATVKLATKTKLKTQVPKIAKGEIEISLDLAYEHQWAESNTVSNTEEIEYQVIVPRMSRVKVSMLATTATCDIPFSYTQRDTHLDATEEILSFDDGIYNGMNCYDFKYEAKEEPLIS